MQKSLILLKPDAVSKGHCGEVIRRFEEAGFRIAGCKMISLSNDLLNDHYSHLADKPFFGEIVDFMQSTPVIGMVLEGENAVDRVRDMLGPTDSTKAEKGTIRGDLGETVMLNICHASDSPEAAEAEVKRFFKDEEVFAYSK